MTILNILMLTLICILMTQTYSYEEPYFDYILTPEERDCVNYGQNCSCIDLWNSDCTCSESNDVGTICEDNCKLICNEVWSPKNYTEYKIANCNIPKYKQYSLEIYTYSQSNDGKAIITIVKELMEIVDHFVDLNIIFVARERRTKEGKKDFWSPYGDIDILEDLYQICSIYHYSDSYRYLPFLYCLNIHGNITERFHNCSLLHKIDEELIENCTKNEGLELMSMNVRQARYIVKNGEPTIEIDGRRINQHAMKNAKSYLSAMCFIAKYPLGIFPWWIFGFLGSLALSLLIISFILKNWSFSRILMTI